jgi:hypothetical protein
MLPSHLIHCSACLSPCLSSFCGLAPNFPCWIIGFGDTTMIDGARATGHTPTARRTGLRAKGYLI